MKVFKKAYKGFNKDMTCRDFQYKEGGEYETDRAIFCKKGFHACENPLDCLSYYAPSESVYHEVELGGTIDSGTHDSKVVATKIKIGARLSISGIVKGAVNLAFGKAKPTRGHRVHAATTGDRANAATTGGHANAATTGDWAHAVTTGDNAHAATTGRCAHATTTGDWAHAATTGDNAHAATTGYGTDAVTTGKCAHAVAMGCCGRAEVKGGNAIAAALGDDSKARGKAGCWLVLAEYNASGDIVNVQTVRIDGEKYKPDTWYILNGGKVVEAE